MQGQPMEISTQSQEIFHGFLLFVKESEEPMVQDGGSQSRIKVVEGGTITAAKKKIVIRSIPKGDSPGRMKVQCSMACTATGNKAIEFTSSDDKILIETKKKVTIATPYSPDSDGEFYLKAKNTDKNEYMMVNGSQYCVCLVIKEDRIELVPLEEHEAEREKSFSGIHRYITVYQDNSSKSFNNTALFFTYKKADQKTYNCYLVPNDSHDKLELDEKEVEGKSYDELRVLYKSYLKFHTQTISPDSLLKCDSDQVPDKKIAAGNNEASPTGSFTASLDSGHGSGEKE
ncbi:PREDICTED: uncharacterized protein LOC109590216 [Amphimedon queenslandica]|uniref:Uncharacterized protein n=1 Tax=Amphimedon queenslandica TaxID=400682 RepID=A0AAN0JWX4_AMPQE|nr:PREDICTED: uncharacterized protein LOC109590216 [Amphimedon queenslandica]|eukprot:XP_019861699.1 PREDICTED: uncharacterized protein LOC109590216 [Amphimedon queenslandica]